MDAIRGSDASDGRFWECALSLYSKRLEVLASNIANADTPHYKARDLDFKAAMSKYMSEDPQSPAPRQDRAHSPSADVLPILYRIPFQLSVDGNTVDMDVERAAFAETAIRYELAVQKVAGEYKEMSELLKSLPY